MNENKHDLFKHITHIQWLFSRYYHQNHNARGPMGDPYRGQGRVLRLLKMQPEISQKDLSELLDMRPQSLGELLSKLERNEYITRTPSESDRRVMIIHLTEKGAEAGNQDEEQPSFNDLFNCLSDEEQANLNEYLSRIIDELEKQFGDDKDRSGYRRHGSHEHEHGFGFGHQKRGGPFSGRK